MMRPLSLVCMLVAVLSGLYLYRTKYRAQMLDREINQTLKLADDSRARSGMLRADYALLNDPIRLQELVDQHLGLKTTTPGQFTTAADLERRLPPIGAPMPEPEPEPDPTVAMIRPTVVAVVPAPILAPILAPLAPPTGMAAATAPAYLRPSRPVARAPTPLIVPTIVATSLPAAAPRSPAVESPMAPSAATQIAMLPAPGATPALAAPQAARSALGMARRAAAPLAIGTGGGAEN